MLAILNERIQKMGVSDDQTRRFRKLVSTRELEGFEGGAI